MPTAILISSHTLVKTNTEALNEQSPLAHIVILAPIPTMPLPPPLLASDTSSIMSLSSFQCIVPSNSKGPVCFTEGHVTLALIEDYAESAQIYVCEYHKKVAPDGIILKLIGGFKCCNIHDAYSLEQNSYDKITFNSFLNVMHLFFCGCD